MKNVTRQQKKQLKRDVVRVFANVCKGNTKLYKTTQEQLEYIIITMLDSTFDLLEQFSKLDSKEEVSIDSVNLSLVAKLMHHVNDIKKVSKVTKTDVEIIESVMEDNDNLLLQFKFKVLELKLEELEVNVEDDDESLDELIEKENTVALVHVFNLLIDEFSKFNELLD
ncbi:hypothetical protein KMW28_27290 [Flammeovirga yaeyamensis]|uniref:Uncharacterized protein n=1 Tax=Flammeovirga yaeyamensis TaxID=367791 RepID=A0AAX1NAQ4_9BACT|nr:hypothetical protein [Flammeovirga yaeyamensis]MBB3700013.1 hypothetical protein [Flammeovirga yaeyamensis]NMF37549.1 hypothetical protein [Flammeovirga yaeyamensis]QWG04606.1 hypothetical protein KMW28_27290 [Flammeovirga yaeyamensis]